MFRTARARPAGRPCPERSGRSGEHPGCRPGWSPAARLLVAGGRPGVTRAWCGWCLSFRRNRRPPAATRRG
ncbi:hypothetical protein SGM_3388 [Streptomyces griseoaurantiacus M045]|uniref:Uncharacterized protein n=1 Tax=Streptomyces griseoaurantiacus M045 TaxID=996637 RepID=F3NJS4_9ACTN|nr:hypothetical protein SGM_3388 [Streptomyces griseoaurantiacus M045]